MKPEHKTQQKIKSLKDLKKQKRYRIAIVTAILNFIFFSGLSIHTLHPYWTVYILLSAASGFITIQLISCTISFLKLKNLKPSRKNLIPNDLIKKIKKKILLVSFSIGFFTFWLMFIFFLQPDPDGARETLQFGDIVFGIIMNSALSLVIYILLAHLYTWVTKINFVQNQKNHNHLASLNDFQENTFNTQHHQNNIWEDWDRDLMNPASSEYQSTYRHWDH